MKKITANTLLKQGEKTYKPVEVDGVIYWYKNIESSLKIKQWYIDDCNTVKQSITNDRNYWKVRKDYKEIIAQSEPKLDGVPVVSLDSYVERLAKKHSENVWGIYFDDIDEDCNESRGENTIKDFKSGYKSNPNQYTLADIKKARDLARKGNLVNERETGNNIYDFEFTDKEIIDQINQIQQITVDNDFNILSYE